MNEKATQNQALKKKSHQRDKNLGHPSCKIFRIFFQKLTREQLRQMDQRISKLITMLKALRPIDDIDYRCEEKKKEDDLPALKVEALKQMHQTNAKGV